MAKTWIIKCNDYPVCKAKGKNEAVKRLKLHLAWDGVQKHNQKWGYNCGMITCWATQDSYYTIEEEIK